MLVFIIERGLVYLDFENSFPFQNLYANVNMDRSRKVYQEFYPETKEIK
jgi:hypothetical protein